MPTARNGAVDIEYAVHGEGPTVVCCGVAGLGAWQWSYLVTPLAREYEVVVFDYRGTGNSGTPDGPYTVRDLTADLDAVLSDHGARSVHLLGAGLGGVVAVEYARRAGRAESLGLMGTPTAPSDVDFDALAWLRAPSDEPEELERSLEVAFAPGTVEAHPDEIRRIVEWRATDDAGRTGWDGQLAAMREAELTDLYEVTTPSLVFHGVEDAIVDPEAGRRLAEQLPRGEGRAVESGHLVHVEQPRVVADELLAWLDERRT
ncbi:alpha/beta fold hydrolase [Halapricum desulfuricans]|uniref:Alpha/beta superfamily hydrolase n=1 Tax=Halapricum desulfuricans TaxID=2841257 RepID=A0A897MZB4_9EURY|nr:alpha/beta hydrolase [Halapricum desulfuricans]QSG05797.1 Alpha/beta superfamily hydrolase [Halapricum desulfuricans]